MTERDLKRLRELAAAGATYAAIGRTFGFTGSYAHQLCQKLGIETARKRQTISPERRAKINAHLDRVRECAAAGMTATETAKELGMSTDTLFSYKHKYGITFRKKPPVGRRGSGGPTLARQRRAKAREEPVYCRICSTRRVHAKAALVQIADHPSMGHVWPRCKVCVERIKGHVAGIRRAHERARARDDVAMDAVTEGWTPNYFHARVETLP